MKKFFLLAVTLLMVLAAPVMAADNDPKKLTVFMWSEYMDPEIITDFEAKFGVKVRLDFYESNEEMIAKLQSGGLGQYDIVMPSTYFIPILKNLNLVQKLDHNKLPNIKNLSQNFREIADDLNNEYTVPYQWGTTGMVLRQEDMSKITPSWALFYDPKAQIGTFVLFDTARDTIGSALKYLGYSINSTNPDEIKKAIDLLTETKKRDAFLGFDNGQGGLNKVLGGVAVLAQTYNGDALRVEEENLHYVTPTEGCEIWIDLIAIPEKAPNADLAHEFINYLLDAEVGAKLSTFTQYATPNEAAKAFLPKETLDNKALYPSAEDIAKMEYMKDLGPANRLYDEAWAIIKTR